MNACAVLYCTPTSVYKRLAAECFDHFRDARSYRGWLPVVAHPPCRSWGRLRHLAKPRDDERELALHAVAQVRRCGGVLEHPAGSLLWREELGGYPLPQPNRGIADAFGGLSISVYQGAFGHVAPKHSWLYVVRPGGLCEVDLAACVNVRAGELRKVASQPSARRMDTPEPFARFLLSLAEVAA